MDLRLRCAARLCWATTDFAVDGPGRRRLLATLRHGPLGEIVAALSAHLGLDTAAVRWERTPDAEGYNDRRFACYRLL